MTGPPSIWLDRVHPDDQDRMRATMAEARTYGRQTIDVEHRIRGSNDEYRRVILRALPVGPPDAEAVRIVGSIHDVEARRQLEGQLRHVALYDEVTGLPNRRLFLERLGVAIASERDGGPAYAVAFFDLDGFKLVNDSLGHVTGDRLLAEVGRRLQRRLRRTDVAARLGGDEFAILLTDISASDATTMLAGVLANIRQPLVLDGRTIAVGASAGFTTSEIDYSTPDEVLRDADQAMYQAKAIRSGPAVLFTLRADRPSPSASAASRH